MPVTVLKMIVFAWKCKDRLKGTVTVVVSLLKQLSPVGGFLRSGLYSVCAYIQSYLLCVLLLTNVHTMALTYCCTSYNFRMFRVLLLCKTSGEWRGYLDIGLQEMGNGGFQRGVNLGKERWCRMGKNLPGFERNVFCMGAGGRVEEHTAVTVSWLLLGSVPRQVM